MPRCSVFLVALLSLTARADVTLAPLFTDHAVLQQDKPVPVWGRAAPEEKITVTFRDQTVHATAGKDGSWIVYLAALKPGSPADLVVAGMNTVRLTDIVVGEVWVCAGQSNMEFRVWGPPGDVYRVDDADAEVAAATHPLIRNFKVERAVAAKPADTAKGAWVVCSPQTAGSFTAVGYFFARDLAARLNVPIGIIDCTWGGTAIESWLSDAALKSDPAFMVVGERWAQALAKAPRLRDEREATLAKLAQEEAAAKAAGPEKLAEFQKHVPWMPPLPGPDSPDAPGSLFNGMVNPLLPGAIRGVLWYQGEANVGRPAEYGALFRALITFWRQHWGQGDFPFLFVQLPGYRDAGDPTGVAWARLREAQASALTLPDTGMAVTIDIGDPANIHPRNKQEVGRRLALLARHGVYDIPGNWSGPLFKAAVREGAALRVTFEHSGSGLLAKEKPLAGFVIAGTDRHFYPAVAQIDNGSVVVSAPQVKEPVAVRYAWADAPDANLFDGAGLPAAPFRSDDW